MRHSFTMSTLLNMIAGCVAIIGLTKLTMGRAVFADLLLLIGSLGWFAFYLGTKGGPCRNH